MSPKEEDYKPLLRIFPSSGDEQILVGRLLEIRF